MSRDRAIEWPAVRAFYEAGHSAAECRSSFGIARRAWYDAVSRGDIISRGEGLARPRGETRAAVAALHGAGLSAAEIASKLGVSRPTVSFHLRRLGIPPKGQFAVRYDWAAIREFYEAGHSASECRARFGFGREAWAAAIRRGVIRPRPRAESLEAILTSGQRRNRHHVKARLLAAGLKQPQCEGCGAHSWRGRPLSLQLHHVNGDGKDNRLVNLMLLCPNCHSQTETWGVRNRRLNVRATDGHDA